MGTLEWTGYSTVQYWLTIDFREKSSVRTNFTESGKSEKLCHNLFQL